MRRTLETLDLALGNLERFLLYLSIIAILATGAIVLMEIAAREFLPFRIPDGVTIVEQLMVASIAFGLSYAMATNAHIAIELFYQHFPLALQRICDIIGLLAGLIAFLPIAYWAWIDTTKFLRRGSYYYGELQLPEWPTHAAFLVGFAVLSLRLLLLFAMRLGGQTSAAASQSH